MTSLCDDPRFAEGIRLFNEREFFACHDVLEDLWDDQVGPEKRFLQGLIQTAVSLFHFTEGNLGGARRMYASCRNYMVPYAPHCLNIDVAVLIEELDHCFAELANAEGEYPSYITCDESLIPVIRSPNA